MTVHGAGTGHQPRRQLLIPSLSQRGSRLNEGTECRRPHPWPGAEGRSSRSLNRRLFIQVWREQPTCAVPYRPPRSTRKRRSPCCPGRTGHTPLALHGLSVHWEVQAPPSNGTQQDTLRVRALSCRTSSLERPLWVLEAAALAPSGLCHLGSSLVHPFTD